MTSQHGDEAKTGQVGSGAQTAGVNSPEHLVSVSIKHAEMLAAQGRYADALEALQPGFTADPQHPHLAHTRAWLLLCLWRLGEGRETLERLLGAHPEMHGSRRLLSVALLHLGQLAEAAHEVDVCLQNEPSNPLHLLQRARVLVAWASERRDRRDRRKLRRTAREHVDQALAFAAGNAVVYDEAARVLWSLGRVTEALDITKRGLAEAPQDAGLRALHAGLVTASVPATGNDSVHHESVHVAEMGKLLAQDPQHRGARTSLFGQLWFRVMTRIDAPMYLVAIAALGLLFGFPSGTASPGGVALWWAVAAVFGGMQWLRYWAVGRGVAAGFRRSIAGSRRIDRVRRLGERAVWVALFACGVVAFVISLTTRDAIAVRWVIVALSVLVVGAFACSLAWQAGYLARARLLEGAPMDRDAVVRLADHRRGLAALVVVRCVGGAALWALFFVSYAAAGFAQSRDDVRAVVLLSTSCAVLSPLIGWFMTWLAEQRARGELDAGISVGVKKPALWSPVLGGVVAGGTLIALMGGVLAVPVMPNQHDAIGQYEVKQPSRSGGNGIDDEKCAGRPAARLACQAERLRDLSETPVEVPEIKPLDIPDFSDLPDLPDSPDTPEVSE